MTSRLRVAFAASLTVFVFAAITVTAHAEVETQVLVSEASNSLCIEPTKGFNPGTLEKLNFKPLSKGHKGPFPEEGTACAPETPSHPVAMNTPGHIPNKPGGPGEPAYPYNGSIPGASWVSISANGEDGGKAPRYYIYNATFNLPCANQAEHAEMNIRLLADNTAGAFLNGVPVGQLASGLPATNHENFGTVGGKSLPPANGIAGGFKPGLNVVQFVVYDESTSYTGLDFRAEVSYPPCAVHWFSNGKLLAEGERESVATSGSLAAQVAETTTKCKVKDREIVENPKGGGAGVDEMTEYVLTGCVAKPSPCPAKVKEEIIARNLPWLTHLIQGPPIRDVIEGIELEVLCGGSPVATFFGQLMPKVGKSTLEFGAGSGELEGPGGVKATFTGTDKLKGPPGDEKITAG